MKSRCKQRYAFTCEKVSKYAKTKPNKTLCMFRVRYSY